MVSTTHGSRPREREAGRENTCDVCAGHRDVRPRGDSAQASSDLAGWVRYLCAICRRRHRQRRPDDVEADTLASVYERAGRGPPPPGAGRARGVAPDFFSVTIFLAASLGPRHGHYVCATADVLLVRLVEGGEVGAVAED